LMNQWTISREVAYTGPAIHTGTVNTVRIMPAGANAGIVFRRVDLAGAPQVKAAAHNVYRTDRCTTLRDGAAEVSTVEHLLAALRGLGIDNAVIEVDGPEIPIADGSAAHFVKMLEEAGPVELEAPRDVIRIETPIWVREGSRLAVALPYDGFKVSATFTNDHRHPVLSDQFAEFEIDPETFCDEIAAARTIGWLSEVKALQERGLALGATMDMAVVLSEDDVLTPLRYPDEPVRHKILDIIGDLYLSGYMHAHIVAVRSGHHINNQLARAIAARHLEMQRA